MRWDPKVDPEQLRREREALDATGVTTPQQPDTAGPRIPARPRETVEEIKSRMEAVSAYHTEKQLQLRLSLRTRMLEKAHDALDRMDAIHVEFVGKDADQVELPTAPPDAFRAYAGAMSDLLKQYRTEVGEATARRGAEAEVKAEDDHERDALKAAIERELEERARTRDPA